MEVDERVPPLSHYRDPLAVAQPRFPDLPEQKDRPPVWEPPRMPAPSPWMPGMAPLSRGTE